MTDATKEPLTDKICVRWLEEGNTFWKVECEHGTWTVFRNNVYYDDCRGSVQNLLHRISPAFDSDEQALTVFSALLAVKLRIVGGRDRRGDYAVSEIDLDGIEMAARSMDWMQVILNKGAPCMTIEHGRFCGRAERWDGHADEGKHGHAFVSLADVTAQFCARIREQDAEILTLRERLRLAAVTEGRTTDDRRGHKDSTHTGRS